MKGKVISIAALGITLAMATIVVGLLSQQASAGTPVEAQTPPPRW